MTARRGPARRKARTWKSGAPDCWWGVTGRHGRGYDWVIPWCIASTRTGAWARFAEWLGPHPSARKGFQCVRVFVLPARSRK